jgi:hypothetical protein
LPAGRGSLSAGELREPLCLRAAGASVPAVCGRLFACGLRKPVPAGCGSLCACGVREPLWLRAAGASLPAGCRSPPVWAYRSPVCGLQEFSRPRPAGVLLSAGCNGLPARGSQAQSLSQPAGAEAPAARRQGRSCCPQAQRLLQKSPCLRAAGVSVPAGCGRLFGSGRRKPIRLRAAGSSRSAGCEILSVSGLRESHRVRAAGVPLSASCRSLSA